MADNRSNKTVRSNSSNGNRRTVKSTTSENRSNARTTTGQSGSARATSRGNRDGKNVSHSQGQKQYPPEHREAYVLTSLIGNAIFGFMGIGIGFVFFLGSALSDGSTGMHILVYIACGIAVALYLLIIYWANRWLVLRCSNKKNKRIDKNRLFWSMLYVICILVISVAYSFLRAAIAGSGVN